jgi:Holliday junction resolvasome RuvABC endonuclease subunit
MMIIMKNKKQIHVHKIIIYVVDNVIMKQKIYQIYLYIEKVMHQLKVELILIENIIVILKMMIILNPNKCLFMVCRLKKIFFFK